MSRRPASRFAACFALRALAAAAGFAVPATGQTFGPWHAIGPFEAAREGSEFASGSEIERDLKVFQAGGPGPALAKPQKGLAGKVSWTALEGTELDIGVIDLAQLYRRPEDAVGFHARGEAYLYRRIECPAAVALPVTLGSDDGLRLWLNGELLVDAAVPRALNVGDHALTLELQAGTNHLLARVNNAGGAWSFRLSRPVAVDQVSINAAIDKGVRWLLDNQLLDGTWGNHAAYGGGAPAFGAYVLLKCGIGPDHAAVQMAVRAAEELPCTTTYALSSQILMLCALEDPSRQAQVEQAVERLLELQDDQGAYAYPVHPENGETYLDLSNTLFAALALRAAAGRDIEIPLYAWRQLAEGTLRFQAAGRAGKAKREGATAVGFAYTEGGEPSGSTTIAGVSVLLICEQFAGNKLPAALREKMTQARESALAWVDSHWRWFENPGSGGHQYFWVYGIERLGALLATERLGDQDWYAQGSRYLVNGQAAAGTWSSARGNTTEVDTMLALLFLRRASAPVTQSAPEPPAAAAIERDIELRAVGRSQVTLWISRVRDERVAALLDPTLGVLDVERVEYLGRPANSNQAPALLASVVGQKLPPSALQRLAARHRFASGGAWELSARLVLRAPGKPSGDGSVSPTVLESQTLRLHVEGVVQAERLEYVAHAARDLLRAARPAASATSEDGAPGTASHLIDGSYASAWTCKSDDARPRATLKLKQAVKAGSILLSPLQPRLAHASAARPARVRLTLNGKQALEFELSNDALLKTVCTLDKPVSLRELQIEILTAHGAAVGAAALGFSEVELLP